jgi:hypothetical protein
MERDKEFLELLVMFKQDMHHILNGTNREPSETK